jgi:hypothetical protein
LQLADFIFIYVQILVLTAFQKLFELLKVATENESIDKVVGAFFVEHDSPLFCEDGGAPLGLTQDLRFEQSVV